MSLFWSVFAAFAWPVFHAFTLFVYFLAFLTVYRAHLNGNLAKAARVTRWACWIIVAIGWAIDIVFNWTFGTLIMQEWPKQVTFTDRCQLHMAKSTWRGKLCRVICSQLDLFQEGGHCEHK